MMTGLNYGFIYDIFVEEKSRGKGIGKLLLEKAEDYCRKKGYSRIALMVSTENDSTLQQNRVQTRTNAYGKRTLPKSPQLSENAKQKIYGCLLERAR